MLRRRSLLALACLAASLPHPAAALEVGRIEPMSAHGQPLLAEIPILSATNAELAGLHAALASPATFARIGLARPGGAVASPRFMVARDDNGRMPGVPDQRWRVRKN